MLRYILCGGAVSTYTAGWDEEREQVSECRASSSFNPADIQSARMRTASCMTLGTGSSKKVKTSWLQNGLCPCRRTQVHPHNATSLPDVVLVVKFVMQYAEDHTILLPGGVACNKQDDIQLFPSSTTKREVWEFYQAAAAQHEGTHAN